MTASEDAARSARGKVGSLLLLSLAGVEVLLAAVVGWSDGNPLGVTLLVLAALSLVSAGAMYVLAGPRGLGG